MAGLSSNTQAILLLTAPLLNGKRDSNSPQLLSVGVYRKLAKWLHSQSRSPSDFLGRDSKVLSHAAEKELDLPPLAPLLERGFQLSQAVERWSQRGIWVVSRADASYPRRFKVRLGESAPPVVYGCGDADLLCKGGLAIVGSRNVSQALLEYTSDTARRCAEAGFAVVSGGARGVDQAAMQGAGTAEGQVIGVLADSLERAVIKREHRDPLMSQSLVLCSPYDQQAGFNAGHAMQRNKLIYALSDASLIINADFKKGGTWSGAIEQLEKYKQIPVYVRKDAKTNKALDALVNKGAIPWPEPMTASAFSDVFSSNPQYPSEDVPSSLFDSPPSLTNSTERSDETESKPDNAAFVLEECVKRLILQSKMPLTEDGVSSYLSVTKTQARAWLNHFCEMEILVRKTRPVRYELRKLP